MRIDTFQTGSENLDLTKKLRPLRRLIPFVRPYRKVLLLALFALAVAALATLAVPFTVRYMIDLGFSHDQLQRVDRYFLALFAVAVVLALAAAGRHYLVSWLGERVVADVRKAVYEHVMTMTPVFFETTRTGEVLSRLTTDTTLIQTVVGSTVSMALRSLFTFVGGLLMLAVTSPTLTALIVVLIPVVIFPIVFLGRTVRRLSRVNQDRVADISAFAGESLNAVQIIQAYTYEKRASARYDDAVETSFTTALKRLRARSLLTAMVILLVFSGAIFLLWMGAKAVLEGTMTAGQLSQFVLYAVIVASSTGVLSEVWGELQRAAGATERLMELLEVRPVVVSPQAPIPLAVPIRGFVAFDSVSFSYPSRLEHTALEDISLTVEPGQTLALVGPSGAGKSTLFQLLLRFYDPVHGTIRLDDVPIDQLSLTQLRGSIGLVPQDTVIFAADALENIRYGHPEASDEQVYEASRLACAHQFLSRLPDGYKTYLGERGARLSGGERQRIAIARAILKNPPVLLLDEATSALDAENERDVQQALSRLFVGRSTLVIAHRLATVLNADAIAVIDAGRIIATGTHRQLMKNDALYRKFAELQLARA